MKNPTRPRLLPSRTSEVVRRPNQSLLSPAPEQVGNLPRDLTSFVGRREQVIMVSRELRTAGLLTLVGPGGVGKTRLALRTAAEARANYAYGAWLVELAPVSDDATQVAAAVASALGIRERPGWDTLDTLRHVLRRRQTLLVLDNCEHILTSCAELVTALLQACGDVSVLATSREPLGVPGEVVHTVPPMPIADAGDTFDQLVECDAVQLLAARLTGAMPSFELTPSSATVAGRICHLVDGLPLAIELAAARAGTMSLTEIAERLSDPLQLLTIGPRTAPQRQRTLRATIDWSYAQLTEPERKLLRGLSVFSGGCTAASAASVCGDVGGESEMHDMLGGLASHSLVTVDTRHPHTRFSMLETNRQYCLERLEQASETQELRGRHRDWCLGLVAGLTPEAFDTERVVRLLPELQNLRAAFRWTLNTRQVESATRLGLGMTAVWHLRGSFSEGRAALSALLNLAPRGRVPPEMPRAGTWAATLAANQGDYAEAERLLSRALRLARESGHEHAALFAENQLGWVAFLRGDVARARDVYEHTYRAAPRPDDPIHFVSRYQLAMACLELGDRDQAMALLDNFSAEVAPAQTPFWVGRLLLARAMLAEEQGDHLAAGQLLDETLAAEREVNDQPGLLRSLILRGTVALERGDRQLATTSVLSEALEIASLYGSKLRLTQVLEALANLLVEANAGASVCLAAAAQQLRNAQGAAPLPSEQERVGRFLEVAKRRLGEKSYSELWQAAISESLEATLALARQQVQTLVDPGSRASSWEQGEPLSERELEVALLVTRGLSNPEIAKELVITRKTVESHVHRVLIKLGLSNRVQIATWGLRHGPGGTAARARAG